MAAVALELARREGGGALAHARAHHGIQEKGRSEIFLDYHLRVGQVTQDTRLPAGHALAEQRLDETEVGEGTTVTLIDARRPPEWVKEHGPPRRWRERSGLDADAPGLVALGRVRCRADARATSSCSCPGATMRRPRPSTAARTADGARLRRVRVVRDYGMFDRREAPQYYPDAGGAPTIHS